MPDRRLVALVGCGRWGQNILRDLTALGCDVAVVARSDASTERARAGGAVTIVDAVEALPEVEGAVVATRSAGHASAVDALLDRDVPLFVEKPLVPDAEAVARLAAIAPDRIFEMHKWRYHPAIEALRDIARSGELGPVVGLRTLRLGWGGAIDDVDPIWHLGPHDLSIALEILGAIPEPIAARADREGADPVGLLAMLGDAPWFVFELSIRSPERRREIRLQCRDGIAMLAPGADDEIQVAHGAVARGAKPPEIEHRAVSDALPLVRELSAFVDHLGGGPPPRSGMQDSLVIAQRIAALRSLAGVSP